VACFDTAFHRGHPEVADRYALPDDLYEEGVRRYGFHGCRTSTSRGVCPRSRRRSPAAPWSCAPWQRLQHVRDQGGRSVDSTMGFTALDGLPMGTRCGQLDPGVVLYLLTEKGYSTKDVEHLLYQRAGLRGLSGHHQRRPRSARQRRCARPPRAGLLRLPGGARDRLPGGGDERHRRAGVHGGIGENSPEIRARVCARSRWLGWKWTRLPIAPEGHASRSRARPCRSGSSRLTRRG